MPSAFCTLSKLVTSSKTSGGGMFGTFTWTGSWYSLIVPCCIPNSTFFVFNNSSLLSVSLLAFSSKW